MTIEFSTSAPCSLCCDTPPDTSLLLGAVFGDTAPVRFGERAPQSGGVEILAVSRRSGLLPPGVVQITPIDGVEAKLVDQPKHGGLGIRRIAHDRERYPARRPFATPFSRRLLA